MADYILRPMRTSDIDGIMRLENESFAAPWSREAFEGELKNKAAIYIVADLDGDIIACGGGWVVLDEAHIVTLAVLPSCRRQGIGSAVLNALLDRFQELGSVVTLLEARVSNTSAIALYKTVGFKPLSVRKRYYEDNGEDAQVMLLEMNKRKNRIKGSNDA